MSDTVRLKNVEIFQEELTDTKMYPLCIKREHSTHMREFGIEKNYKFTKMCFRWSFSAFFLNYDYQICIRFDIYLTCKNMSLLNHHHGYTRGPEFSKRNDCQLFE